jgi:hypothetical protein
MSSASLLIRGWTITLIAAVFVLSDKKNSPLFFLLAYFPVVAFWFLDGYYLCLEKRYRSLFDKVRKKDDFEIDYCMDVDKKEFNLWHCCTQASTALFYLVFIFAITVIMFSLPATEQAN